MIGYQISLGFISVLSLLALFDNNLLGDRQKYQQLAAICIAAIVCWTITILFR
ncbi:hypothetical protein FAM21834_02700 [Lentilactobacillus parabuchneri]|uniref:hypothetical protein n=1 Tax=Lentilactobacillus parabuchneri TaxID=152331 RepID=UPI000A24E3AE|nr:hypothetical protein [Lentilactobacillus parabuchneri]MDB1104744.1 hypothetical protein [Lentilactobacillus parabuchneri]ORN05389.1 hypothetical protein FAM21834_02700 [Lentilactobacillus parabuchneri]ORN39592.1 hypothetical protein FAM23282_01430 [Lentilactobacillus parabuchneri]